jgi:hypothetical protein
MRLENMTISSGLEIPIYEFISMSKIPRLNREIVITEKIDGTNASVYIHEDGTFKVGARNRWITPGEQTDNFGFAAWAYENKTELLKLGVGRHFGEWFGSGINRGYGLNEKRFILFRHPKDVEILPCGICVVPELDRGLFSSEIVQRSIERLRAFGSVAIPGFLRPEGIVVYHTASGQRYKVTLEKDEKPKSSIEKV